MKTLVVNRSIIVSIFVAMLLIYGVQGISYGQGEFINVPSDLELTVTPGETNTVLKVSFRDLFKTNDTKAYNVQFRRKSPQGEWKTVCTRVAVGQKAKSGSFFIFLFGLITVDTGGTAGTGIGAGKHVIHTIFTGLEPGVTYEARYRDTNLAECNINPPDPEPWSEITEGTTHLVTPPRVEFANAKFARIIREKLNLDTEGAHIELLKIPEAELQKLAQWEKLSLWYEKTGNLSDLTLLTQYLTSLRVLILPGNKIIDLTPLAHLTSLQMLNLSGNEIIDLTPLAHLTSLRVLDLANNEISDITPLAQLTLLRVLDLSDNEIIDLTPLAHLTQLTELDLSDNEIIDLTPLAQLTELTELDLSHNNIRDLMPLLQLSPELEIYTGGNPVSFSGTPTDIALLTVSAAQHLTGATLNGSSVTLMPVMRGTVYDTSIDNIRNALTVSGMDGVTISDVVRVSDTELKVTLGFTGSLINPTELLTFSLEAEAVTGYEGRALTGNILVHRVLELTASSSSPLTAATLDKSAVTLALGSGSFKSLYDTKKSLRISGIPGISVGSHDIRKLSDTAVTIRLGFNGHIDKDSILTFTVDADAFEYYSGKSYRGPALTAEIPVTVAATTETTDTAVRGGVGLKIFWTDSDTERIQRANLDGSDVQDLGTQELRESNGIALDVEGGKMYWTDSWTNKIQRANLDGSDVQDLVTQGLDAPSGIALDVAGGKMYWTDVSTDKIQRANLDGSDVQDLVTQGLDVPSGIALDVEGGKMYWTDSGTERIQRANLDGSDVQDLVTHTQGLESPSGIALDVEGGKMYWTDSWTNNIQRANLDGSNVEDLVTRGLRDPRGIALDVVGGKMYWTDWVTERIQRANLDGSNIEDVVTRRQGWWRPRGIAIGILSPVNLTITTDTTVSLIPSSVASPAVGQQVEFSLKIAEGEAVAGYQASVQFDTTALRYVSGANGDFLPTGAFFVEPKVEGNLVKLNAASLAGESKGDGTLATLTFEVIAVKEHALKLSDVLLTDSAGETSVPQIENAQTTDTPQIKGDVNGDGTVNIADLVLVASNLGKTGQNTADVNGDGQVNIADLVLVAGVLGTSAAAPSRLYPDALEMFTSADVRQWLSQAHQLNLMDMISQRGVLFLEQLLAALIPKETSLLANYPNPFNPETWIPYHLAKDAEVTLHIYTVNGTLVRTLSLGHQAAGMYQSRSRAAYWDGRNAIGEPVASGVYFYTLTAGDFSATRKMLIRK